MKRLTLQLIPLLLAYILQAQVGIGTTTPHSSAILEISSTSKGFLLPRLTQAQRDALVDPAQGLLIYNTDSKSIEIYTGITGNIGSHWKLTISADTSTNGTAMISNITDCNTASTGILGSGASITANSVTQTITVEVTKEGTYSIEAEANGVTFAKSGVFSALGSQTIELIASGTPTALGTHSFTINTSPSCSFNRTTVSPPPTLPANIELSDGVNLAILSIYDDDYFPYNTPTSASATGSEAAGGSTETLIDIGGELTTTGKTLKIPYTVTNSPVNLLAFSQTVTVASAHIRPSQTEASTDGGGIAHQVTLSWEARNNIPVGKGFIEATIKAETSNMYPIKLDLNKGLGTDNNGLTIATFNIPLDSTLGNTGNVTLRITPGIPDRKFGETTTLTGGSTGRYHDFIYLPVTAADGNIWLNNNLGANYANMNIPGIFAPAQQASTYSDYHAYGSMFQWGRYSDGHELINWTNSTTGTPVTTTISNDHSQTTTPNNSTFYRSDIMPSSQNGNWLDFGSSPNPTEDGLWQDESGDNNPCPPGFRVPTRTEYLDLFNLEGISSSAYPLTHSDGRERGVESTLAFSCSGLRLALGNVSYSGNSLNSWNSTIMSGWGASVAYISNNSGIVLNSGIARGLGCAVRCIKD
ncbi:MAG: hypothetical protein N4A45_00025 [Flavobacteriales bacterium]|jgi:uncharacterized protein (TIGR02145 family)|nr:hypothetical protein [Flavobacteriales bacterium]